QYNEVQKTRKSESNQHNSAKQQGNHREQDSGANIAQPIRIGRKAQIGQASHVADAQKRAKQEHSCEQDSAVKERLEIGLRQKREHAVRCKRLSCPEKNWSKECSDDDDRDKIGR